jgi:Raf kinase inhibitor-like YbhB/YbcL family protein
MLLLWAACRQEPDLVLTSEAFAPEGTIPVEHTCDGRDLSPPLAWRDVPPLASTLAMIVQDEDTSSRTVHWLWWDLDANATGLPEDLIPQDSRMVQGTSDMGPPGWFGPCPPPQDDPHRYVFTLYAVDGALELPREADRDALEDALQGRILASGELTGEYGR